MEKNPYQPSTTFKSEFEKPKLAKFVIGARNGLLWSLILAAPTSWALYLEELLPFARDNVILTNAIRISAGLKAIAATAFYIVLPWSLVAGIVRMRRTLRQAAE